MDREEALDSVTENVANPNLVKHMLAVEAVMKALAKRFGENEQEWGLTGLLHDIDVELTGGDMKTHSRLGADMVRDLGGSEAMAQAVLTHNQAHGFAPQTRMDKALICADPLTGLITATTLVRPDKKLEGVEVSSVKKKFKETRFAAGVNREQIAACSTLLGIELDEFIDIGLKAMQDIAAELGL
jgi:putative nucleotidyltransferase with HDIG domain